MTDQPSGIVHIAGIPIHFQGRFVRQRCGWCGAMIEDVDLAAVASMDGEGLPMWAPGHLVAIDGNVRYDLGDITDMPENCCANLDPAVTT